MHKVIGVGFHDRGGTGTVNPFDAADPVKNLPS